jgi:protein-disulfide isomerase
MMKTYEVLLNAALAAAALCAVGTSALVVDREFGLGILRPVADGTVVEEVADWRSYGAAGHQIGPTDAPVSVVVFADYQCPYCEVLHTTLGDMLAEDPTSVRVVLRHFPLRVSSREAALAAECADAQGRFIEYHNMLYAVRDSIGHIPWRSLAERVGVADPNRLEKCVADRHYDTQVTEDREAALRLGGRGTPMMLVNSKLVYGSLPQEVLEEVIAQAGGL